jgi:HPt (histidine-containing phosphotransfer) domain-containing protein
MPHHAADVKRENWQMAALNIAFEAPDNARTTGPSRERPVDLVHLAKQTMGDKLLEIEVLQMFTKQARACLNEIGSGNPDKAKAGAHRLKGAASAVGAFKVADAAAAYEERIGDAACMAGVGTAVVEAENFIMGLSR